MTIHDTLAALADPVRRETVNLLRRGPSRPGELAAELGVAPSAMSRHLRELRNAGIIEERLGTEDARARVVSLRPGALRELTDWLREVERFWSGQLGAFAEHIERRGSRS